MNAIKALEKNVSEERASFRSQIQKLRTENAALTLKVRQLTTINRKTGDVSPALRRRATPPRSSQSFRNCRRRRSPSPSFSGQIKTSSLSRGNWKSNPILQLKQNEY